MAAGRVNFPLVGDRKISNRAEFEKRIADLEAVEPAGFFGPHDSDLWNRASALVCDEAAPMTIRIRALGVIDRITGESGDLDEQAVHAYILDMA